MNMTSERSGTQSIERAAEVLRVLASRNTPGLRLVDISRIAKLERSTVHRILKCLKSEGMVKHDDETRRYSLGHLIFELGLAASASSNFDLRDICHSSLVRLSERTGDTAFLTMRSGFDTVCIDRTEGSFPIKALTLDVGTRRPLGVGAGGLALLMSVPRETREKIVSSNALRLAAYNNMTVPALTRMLERCRDLGYAVNEFHVTPGATSVGVPIHVRSEEPFLAISIGAISSRMTEGRQKEIALLIKTEVSMLETTLADRSYL